MLEAIAKVGLDRLNVVHAPRHLERVEGLGQLVVAKFGTVALRSHGEAGPYLILDTYGELSAAYSVADIVIVGGGFSDLGGQNIFQPLAHGKPLLHGVHMQNFRDIAVMADRAGAALACATPVELADALNRLLSDPNARAEMGRHAQELIQANVGASKRYAKAIAEESIKAK